MTEGEMVGWRRQLYAHEFEQVWRVDNGQEAWCAAVHEVVKGRTQLRDQKSTTCLSNISLYICTTSSLFSPLLIDL